MNQIFSLASHGYDPVTHAIFRLGFFVTCIFSFTTCGECVTNASACPTNQVTTIASTATGTETPDEVLFKEDDETDIVTIQDEEASL